TKAAAPAQAATPAPKPATAAASAPVQAAPARSEGARVFASPLARRIATQSGVALTLINGSGPHGRIVRADVEAAAKGGVAVARAPAKPAAAPATAPSAPAAPSSLPDARLFFPKDSYEEIPHDSMRRSIAKRLTASKRDIPHYYLQIDCALDALL